MTRHPVSSAGRPGTPRAPRPLWCAAALWLASLAGVPGIAAGGSGPGISLTWNDCSAGASASPTATFDCLVNVGQHELVAGFHLPQAVDSVVGLELVIDLQAATATLPPWWELQPGGCRQNLLDASADVAGTSCTDPWAGNGTGLIADYQTGMPRGGAAQARIRAVVAVSPSDSARSLIAGLDYSALRILLPHAKSTGPLSCSGCAIDVCLVFNSMWLRVLPGGSGDVYLDVPAGAGAQQATWQGTAADCAAVPVRNATWGALKGMYR